MFASNVIAFGRHIFEDVLEGGGNVLQECLKLHSVVSLPQLSPQGHGQG